MRKLFLVSLMSGFAMICFAQKGLDVQDTLVGTLNVLAMDDFENGTAKYVFQIICDSGITYQLEESADLKMLSSGDRIRIIRAHSNYKNNILSLKTLGINEGTIQLVEKSNLLNSSVHGEQNYAIILFNFKDDQSKPVTVEEVDNVFFGPTNSANSNIKEMSFGKTSLSGEVYDNNGQWYTIDMDAPKTRGEVSDALFLSLARAAADKDIDYRNYKSIVYIFPYLESAGYGGIGTSSPVPTETDEGNLTMHFIALNGSLGEYKVTHEVLHNFGLGHDSKRIYLEGSYLENPLQINVYGNLFSLMGGAMGHISIPFSKYIWSTEYNVFNVDSPGSYPIKLAALADTSLTKQDNFRGILVPRDSVSSWSFEFRDKVGMDKDNYGMSLYGSGLVVTLKEHRYNSDIHTYLPSQDDILNNDVIKENEEFLDPSIGLRARAVGINDEGLMQVEIHIFDNKSNLRINKRDLNWPDTVTYGSNKELNYSLFNNGNIQINEAFQVSLYQKINDGQWQLVSGQSTIITNFPAGNIIQESFDWSPQAIGTYNLKIIADDLGQLNELSRFDNYAPASPDGHQITVLPDCSDIEIIEEVSICEGESYNEWSETGVYQRILNASTGCDSIIITNLTVNPNFELTEEVSICEGESYNEWSETGVYQRILNASTGCDSIIITNLIVNPNLELTEEVSICEGESYNDWSGTGVYQRILNASTGCDSIIITNLTVNPNFELTEEVSICEGESYNEWSETGVYQRILNASTGCDSIIITNLTVNVLPNAEIIFSGDTLSTIYDFIEYQWYDQKGQIPAATSNQIIIDHSGIYFLEVTDENGCTAMSNGIDFIWTNIIDVTNNKHSFQVYPNPNDGKFVLRIDNENSEKYQIRIINELGQVQLDKELYLDENIFEKEFNVSHFSKGIYIVMVIGTKKILTEPIIIK